MARLRAIFKLVLASIAILCLSCQPAASRKWPLVIVLGIDGMDPNFVERHISELPNLQALMERGEFKRLQTTMPPQSPVAWSTFSTGLDPSEHGIFDFVYRDPQTMMPFSAMGETDMPLSLSIGPFRVPLGSPHVHNLRRGKVFWQLLADAGVPIRILRMPVNYPPEKAKGDSLAGMGVPDLRGTFGTFTFFTDNPSESRHPVSGGSIVPVQVNNDAVQLSVQGPANPFWRDEETTYVKLNVNVDPFENVARFEVQNRSFILRAGEWSEWIPIRFPIISGIESSHGMMRVYAKGYRPDFEVYVSPVNFDPRHPDTTISAPPSYSADLAAKMGLFYTQGMAEDTEAYRHGVFDRQEYLKQSRLVSDEQIKMLKHGLEGFSSGLFFLHFSGVDQNSHMLWGKFDNELLGTYKLVDDALGWVVTKHPNAEIIVMSDHGFSSFDRAVNLNAWLLQQGLSKSAYALGLNAVYLKLAGREKYGTIAPRNAAQDLQDLGIKLTALRDPKDGRQVITRAWSPHPEFRSDIKYIPDLIIGFAPGYRSSWEGSMGSSAGPVIEDNNDAWIGDHCIAPEYVPGVLISNRRSYLQQPRLKDLTASLLAIYGVPSTPEMNGKDIY